jgi:ADP-heptose:LPS heptosyltransferase
MKILVTMPQSIGDAIQTLPALDLLAKSEEVDQIYILMNYSIINLFKYFFKIKANYIDSNKFFPKDFENYNFLVDFKGQYSLNYLNTINSLKYVTHTIFHDPDVKYGTNCIKVNGVLKESIFFNAIGFCPRPAWSFYYEMIIAADFSGKVNANNFLFIKPKTKKIRLKSKNISILPCGTLKSKHWDIKNYIFLIEYYKKKGLSSDVYLGPNEKHYLKYFMKKNLDCNIYYNLSLIDLARRLYTSRIVISNDCGPMHIAGVLGVPLIGIFNETLPACWFPYKNRGQMFLGGNKEIIYENKFFANKWPPLRNVLKKINRELNIHD